MKELLTAVEFRKKYGTDNTYDNPPLYCYKCNKEIYGLWYQFYLPKEYTYIEDDIEKKIIRKIMSVCLDCTYSFLEKIEVLVRKTFGEEVLNELEFDIWGTGSIVLSRFITCERGHLNIGDDAMLNLNEHGVKVFHSKYKKGVRIPFSGHIKLKNEIETEKLKLKSRNKILV